MLRLRLGYGPRVKYGRCLDHIPVKEMVWMACVVSTTIKMVTIFGWGEGWVGPLVLFSAGITVLGRTVQIMNEHRKQCLQLFFIRFSGQGFLLCTLWTL